MKWNLAGVLALLVLDVRVPPADACGIKLVVKTQTPRKAVARSSNPSHLLLLGTPPHRLERELAAAGHDVEVEPTAADAKRDSYAVVVVDAKQADEARTKFASAVVIVRSGDVTTDISSIESQVTRTPVRTNQSQPVVAARQARQPIAAGPPPTRPVAVKAPEDAEPAPVPPPVKEPTPASVAVAPKQPPVEQRPAPRQPPPPPVAATQPGPAPARATHAAFRGEQYFSLNSASVGDKPATLQQAVRWLTGSADVNVVIEGYADPTGTHEGNMALGQKRAEAVRDYLAAAGIDQSRMEVVSYGDTRLKYGRTDGRNRRVAIVKK
jgi:peptidoglycan-associated lipoprotein